MTKSEIVAMSVSGHYEQKARDSGADHFLRKTTDNFKDWLKSQAGKTVLVIDDDPDFVYLTTKLLEANGAMAHGCTSDHSALDKVLELKPDIVLTDICLGQEDGTALIEWIKILQSPD